MVHAQLRPAKIVYSNLNPGPAKLHSLELLHWCGVCYKIRAEMEYLVGSDWRRWYLHDRTSEGIRLAVVFVPLKGHLLANFKILLR